MLTTEVINVINKLYKKTFIREMFSYKETTMYIGFQNA